VKKALKFEKIFKGFDVLQNQKKI